MLWPNHAAAEMAMKQNHASCTDTGGYSYVREYQVERMMRDARDHQIYEGTWNTANRDIQGIWLKDIFIPLYPDVWARNYTACQGSRYSSDCTGFYVYYIMGLGFTAWKDGSDLMGTLYRELFVLVIFLCVILHEYGHALVARKFGLKPRYFIDTPIVGLPDWKPQWDNPKQELLIALAGPMVNVWTLQV